MYTNKKTARIVGVLYIIGTLAGILSVVITKPILAVPDYLRNISTNENQIILGALCVLIMGLALALVPVFMYPILKKYNEVLALGYVVFRGALETVTYIASVICWLFLIPLCQEYVKAGAPDASYYKTLGSLFLKGNDWISIVIQIVFPLGALILYHLLYQFKLIPRWISAWGLIAIILWLATNFSVMFGLIENNSALQNVLALPIAVQEMVMAVWMIVKGFNVPAITTNPANTDMKMA